MERCLKIGQQSAAMTNHDTYILYTLLKICVNHLVYNIWRQLKESWLASL